MAGRKPGDLIRFRPPYYIGEVDAVSTTRESRAWIVGILIKDHDIEMSTVLYTGGILRVPSKYIQKFGRGYFKNGC
tara:strand:- start:256 stop:483 length:228 start_codon:yes stop_codon:yes gene_type:complete